MNCCPGAHERCLNQLPAGSAVNREQPALDSSQQSSSEAQDGVGAARVVTTSLSIDAGPVASQERTNSASPSQASSSSLSSSAIAALPSLDIPTASSATGANRIGSAPLRGNGSAPLPSASTTRNELNFKWGLLSGSEFSDAINAAYAEAVHWRRNVFQVPSGREGKDFVSELARLIGGYADASALEPVAIKAAMTLPLLVLQKPSANSTAKDHSAILGRRLRAWKNGEIDSLVTEGRVLQKHLQSTGRKTRENDAKGGMARAFARLMFEGRVRAALRLLSDSNSGGVLNLDDMIDGLSVREILKRKHPDAAPADPETLLQMDDCDETLLESHPVLFERIDGKLIRSVALTIQGAGGPSGVDAAGWRRLCTSFGAQSKALCASLASFTKRICTSNVNNGDLSAFIACRLIPLDKQPGVRPIGICEVMRRIVGKTIMKVVGPDVREAVGPLQLCAGLNAGCEAAVHAMNDIFQDGSTEGVLLVDASNAFNTINRKAALHNARVLCPSIAFALTNIYQGNAELFVGGEKIYSCEGTTQGDPMAMAMYALAVAPLLRRVSTPEAKQVWFADDATAGGKLRGLRAWWDVLSTTGPAYGYFANCDKTWLLVKDGLLQSAKEVFDGTGVRITQDGRRHLGSALGSEAFVSSYIDGKVQQWSTELERLSGFAESEPHAAYAALTHGLMGHWKYFLRTIKDIAPRLQPLEDIIQSKLLPALTGRFAPGQHERDLLALPPRHGGLGILNPAALSATYAFSREATQPLVSLIAEQGSHLQDVPSEQRRVLSQLLTEKRQREAAAARAVFDLLPSPELREAVLLAAERGSSSWLTALPLSSMGLALHKGAFRDALCLRYGWQPALLPTTCVCGAAFNVAHALSCPTGGFPTLRHNEIRDLLADLMTSVAHDVQVEPVLQPVTGETFTLRSTTVDDGARLDLAASGVWGGRFERAFFDVRVVNPFARSNLAMPVSCCYRRHEADKRRKYLQRITEIEHASFVPFVVAATGGLGPAATTTLQRLAQLTADASDQPYSRVMGWLRCRVSFALLRGAIMCLRGARSAKHRPVTARVAVPADLAIAEANIDVS